MPNSQQCLHFKTIINKFAMKKELLIVVILTILPLWNQSISSASDKVALVIGNKDYTYIRPPLETPLNDAQGMADVLRKIGYDVTFKTDLNNSQFTDAIYEFGNKIKRGGVALFYFAGHGIQVREKNYLIPIDFNNKRIQEHQVHLHSIQADTVLNEMDNAKSDANIMILDACRDNPFNESRSLNNRGLAKMVAPAGTFIAYSTAAGKVAADGGGNGNSIYTKYLINLLGVPGLSIDDVFRKVGTRVREQSSRDQSDRDRIQIPWVSSSLLGEEPFYFIPPNNTPPPQNPSPQGDRTIGQYIDHGNGTITDTKTGLMWKRCAEGLSGVNCENGETGKYTWDDAVLRFKDVAYAGYSDWRLPTFGELETLIYCSSTGERKSVNRLCNEGSKKPTINQQAFPNTEANTKVSALWSRSPCTPGTSQAWYIGFYHGYYGEARRIDNLAVRLVRGGQNNKPNAEQPPQKIGQYIDHGNGTITDTKTSLMWKRCAEGLSGVNCEKGKTEEYSWNAAENRFKNVAYAGSSDWRLPTIDELKTLVYCSKGVKNNGWCNDGSERPTINQQDFPNTKTTWFWSGTPFTSNSDRAWGVDFYVGGSYIYSRSGSGAVRLVRGGQ
jgi:hypothetical protein